MHVARMCAACIVSLLLCRVLCGPSAAEAQAAPLSYRLILHNHYVQVFDLYLGPERQVPIRDNNNGLLWVALDSGILEVQSREEKARDFQFDAGDVRLFRRHEFSSARNKTGAPVHSVIVELLRLNEGGCGCAAEVERVVCGCARSGRLPPYWALALYGATLAETTLSPGQSLKESTNRDDTLLIAISSGEFRHEATAMHVSPGSAAIRRTSDTAARPSRMAAGGPTSIDEYWYESGTIRHRRVLMRALRLFVRDPLMLPAAMPVRTSRDRSQP